MDSFSSPPTDSSRTGKEENEDVGRDEGELSGLAERLCGNSPKAYRKIVTPDCVNGIVSHWRLCVCLMFNVPG